MNLDTEAFARGSEKVREATKTLVIEVNKASAARSIFRRRLIDVLPPKILATRCRFCQKKGWDCRCRVRS